MDMERDIILSYVNCVIMCTHCSVKKKNICLDRIVYLQHCYCIINTFLINYCLMIIFPLIMHYARLVLRKENTNVLFLHMYIPICFVYMLIRNCSHYRVSYNGN